MDMAVLGAGEVTIVGFGTGEEVLFSCPLAGRVKLELCSVVCATVACLQGSWIHPRAVVFVTLVVIIGTFGAAGIDELFFFVIVNFVLFLPFPPGVRAEGFCSVAQPFRHEDASGAQALAV